MQPSDHMQEIFDRAESATDAIHMAEGCTMALIGMIDRLCNDPDFVQQAAAMIAATERFLREARAETDRLTHLAMESPG